MKRELPESSRRSDSPANRATKMTRVESHNDLGEEPMKKGRGGKARGRRAAGAASPARMGGGGGAAGGVAVGAGASCLGLSRCSKVKGGQRCSCYRGHNAPPSSGNKDVARLCLGLETCSKVQGGQRCSCHRGRHASSPKAEEAGGATGERGVGTRGTEATTSSVGRTERPERAGRAGRAKRVRGEGGEGPPRQQRQSGAKLTARPSPAKVSKVNNVMPAPKVVGGWSAAPGYV